MINAKEMLTESETGLLARTYERCMESAKNGHSNSSIELPSSRLFPGSIALVRDTFEKLGYQVDYEEARGKEGESCWPARLRITWSDA